MKKLLVLTIVMLLGAQMIQAQRFAVVGFKAGANVSLSSIDGISETFSTYFRPQGYTPVDRLYIDKALAEQRIQRSTITESEAVAAGRYMNVSKIVVGKVYVSFDGGYQVDVVVLDVESGLSVANDGTTVTPGSYRQSIETLAKRLAGKIAIKPGQTVPPTPTQPAKPNSTNKGTRNNVEVLYGYLKIFPNELGTFQSEPVSIIGQINAQAMYGYNNWRIPTNEELSLMRANNYLSSGEYMTKENKRGVVLLVTDGKDYATLQAEEQERQRALEKQRQEELEKQRQEEQERQRELEKQEREKQRRIDAAKAQGYVYLGLPSGTLWKDKNENGFYDYDAAVRSFGSNLPTKEQLEELKNSCSWTWTGSGYKVVGPSGESIVLPAAGYRTCDGGVNGVGSNGNYRASIPDGSGGAWGLNFYSGEVRMYNYRWCGGLSVRLVQD